LGSFQSLLLSFALLLELLLLFETLLADTVLFHDLLLLFVKLLVVGGDSSLIPVNPFDVVGGLGLELDLLLFILLLVL
jgi:hypothetical protein